MSTSPRYYLIADDGKVHRLARTIFYKLLEQKIPTPLPEFIGKRAKLARVNVRLDGRRAIAVTRASYTFITFDANGFFDSTEWDAATESTIETWTVPTLPSSAPVIDARARFADRRYELEQTWQSSDDLRRQLFANATAGRATYH